MNEGTSANPEAIGVAWEPPIPMASGVKPEPSINGPKVVGTTPGRPFIFLIPATGEGPLVFSASELPNGLSLDPSTGIITGSVEKPGEYDVMIQVKGKLGEAKRRLRIIAGDHKLAQTPPLGWNSWNVWAGAVDDAKVRAAADMMVTSGLASHGYQYINIDDCWEGPRDSSGEITTNERFPDMKALADYVHSKGLKIGIYSSPGQTTCAGYPGSYQYEEQDAKTWAKWGIDYVKYDWCSYGGIATDGSVAELQKPYVVMREALDKCDRDIVYSLCQYGMGEVWKWGKEVGGNCWRTTGDIGDTWVSMSSIGFSQDGHEAYSGPGHWNDPDMMVVGKVGWGPDLHQTQLTPNEQITHMTLWTIVASPLLLGCDLSQLDQFDVDLLSNDEVLDIHQDPLGQQGKRYQADGELEVWARPLWDGTMAVGLFNRGAQKAKVTAGWTDLGISGSQPVRDVWLQKDLGEFEGSFSYDVPAHGAFFVKVGRPVRSW